VVKGGLREDELQRRLRLRIRQCWDFESLRQHAQRLSLRLDMRVPDTWARVDSLLGATARQDAAAPDLLLPPRNGAGGSSGMLDLSGPNAVRVDLPLLENLRALLAAHGQTGAVQAWAN
jgi:DNA polymerase-3 subunit alpha